MAALNAQINATENSVLHFNAGVYHSKEKEFSDVIARYQLGDVDTNLGSDSFGDIVNAGSAGGQFNRSRNELDLLI